MTPGEEKDNTEFENKNEGTDQKDVPEPSQEELNKDIAENPSTEKQVPDDQANQGGG
jgi:hypothetical protein